MNSMNLNGKRALVTGGAVRIGKAITEALQAEGCDVVVHYQNSELEARQLSPKTIQANLEDMHECTTLLQRASDLFGPMDILVNNASIFTRHSMASATPEHVQREFQINLFAPMELTRIFASQTEQGATINLLDRRIRCNDTSCTPYSISKKAFEDFTKHAALEYAPGIRVNAVAPGPVLPPPDSSAKSARELAGLIPLEALPRPQEISEAAIFLLRAESTTGQVIYVDGGQHLLGNGV
jgi:NAD(P)-dependent dehydrogenase (short-subunit alcohol dehydrogenase family)